VEHLIKQTIIVIYSSSHLYLYRDTSLSYPMNRFVLMLAPMFHVEHCETNWDVTTNKKNKFLFYKIDCVSTKRI